MSTARASIIKSQRNSPPNPHEISPLFKTGTTGFIVGRLDFGAFNATTNPEGIQGLGASDFAGIGIVNKDGTSRFNDNRVGSIRVTTVIVTADTTLTLGTANNILVKVVRSATSVLPDVTLGTIAEASLTANNANVINLGDGVLLETGDYIALVPDGALSGTAAPASDIYVTVDYIRELNGSRLDTVTVVA